ncbi:MAG: YciI family protein [Pseudomonadota bacterium]
MPKFAFFLPHAPDRYEGLASDAYEAIVKDYVAWVETAAASGAYDGGYKLADDGGKVVVSQDDEIAVHDGPFAELAEVVGGVMVVEAADMDAAIEMARAHPHLRHNKRIVIRAVDDV